MNKFVKYLAVGLAGYMIGHFEIKYKIAKFILDAKIKEEAAQKENEAQ